MTGGRGSLHATFPCPYRVRKWGKTPLQSNPRKLVVSGEGDAFG